MVIPGAQELLSMATIVPKTPCIYILFLDGVISYIGCSKNVISRVGFHSTGQKLKKDFDSYLIIPVPDGVKMEDMEREYIRALNPTTNVVRLMPSTFDPCDSISPHVRVAQRVEAGQSAYSAAKAEGLMPRTIYNQRAYRRRKDEANQLLF